MNDHDENGEQRWRLAAEAARAVAGGAVASVRENPGLLLLSLVIAATLWVFVTESENPTRVDTFPQELPVTAVNVGTGLAVANQLQSVEVRISAPEDRWDRLTAANFRAVVDLNGLDARVQRVPVEVEVTGISGVRVLGTEPATVTVNLEPLRSKEVPIETRLRGTLPRGYELISIAADRRTVTVNGPESLIELVAAAVAEVDVTGLTVAIDDTVELVAEADGGGEIRGVTLDPQVVGVRVDVEQTELTRNLPIEAQVEGNPPPGYRIAAIEVSPPVVALSGPIDVLGALDALVLPPISVEGLEADFVSNVDLPVPAGARAGTDRVTVTIRIAPVAGSALLQVAPLVVNLGPDLEAQVAEGAIAVLLSGQQGALDAFIAQGVRPTVDVGGLIAGTYSLPLDLVPPPGVEVVSMQPERVSVTLTGP